MTVKGMIRHTSCVHAQRPQLVAPGDGRKLILERRDRLPSIEPRVADRYRRFFASASQEERTHVSSVRDHLRVNHRNATRGLSWAITLALVLGPAAGSTASGAVIKTIPFSTASGHVVQRQPAPGTCHAVGAGLYAMPDPRCTPGALNPAVTQSTLTTTICRSGWTSTVRPPESVTNREKFASMNAYGDTKGASAYEYDHLVSLELGGAVNAARNLWPEPDYPVRAGFYRNPKDRLERALNHMVCNGTMPLKTAQRLIATEWVAAFHTYG
jgi:hypothetical protein